MEKAKTQLDEARSKEEKSQQNFNMLKQSLTDEIEFATKDMTAAKKGLSASSEKKSTAEGDLAVTSKDLQEDIKTLADLHEDCMTTAQTFEAEVKSRAEELKALAVAKKAINENVSGAEDLSYGLTQQSFLQTSSGLAHFEAIRFVRDLAKKQHAPALAQLANRMATTMRMSGMSKEDIFSKVKDLIREMIVSLEAEADADAKHHAYCVKELKYNDQKKADRVAEIEKLTTAIDSMSAKSAQLKEEVAQLEKELRDIAASQAEMDKIRAEEHETFLSNKADMEQGIKGVKMALKVLTEYYSKSDKAHVASEGAGEGIIGLLEVVESDFEKGLMDMVSEEDSSQAEYEKMTKENEIATATKQQDVKYKTKESKDLDKSTAEATSDREAVQVELAAVEKALEKLHEECDETAPTYEELVARRSAEIAGLKQALQILEGEAALIQGSSKHLRSVRKHIA
jgi:uncharacterized protein YlxW (UPF0749 family)